MSGHQLQLVSCSAPLTHGCTACLGQDVQPHALYKLRVTFTAVFTYMGHREACTPSGVFDNLTRLIK